MTTSARSLDSNPEFTLPLSELTNGYYYNPTVDEMSLRQLQVLETIGAKPSLRAPLHTDPKCRTTIKERQQLVPFQGDRD